MPEQIRLPTRMNFQAARELHARLVVLRAQDVEIDASHVEFLGGIAAQTLIAAQRTWHGDGRRFDLLRPSGGFCASLADLGLTPLVTLSEGTDSC
jgi:chemotaxis protein CheX